MSFVSMVFGWGGGSSIGVLPLDALINERTSLNSRATEYPVEDGPPVTDHVVQESELLTLEGWVTAAEASLLGGMKTIASRIGGHGGGGRSKLIGAKEALRKIHADRVPVTVVTGLDVYVGFVMERCDIDRNNEDGERFSISADFRKIRKVAMRQAVIPPEKVKGGVKGKAGATKTNAGKAAPKEVSVLKSDTGQIIGKIKQVIFGK